VTCERMTSSTSSCSWRRIGLVTSCRATPARYRTPAGGWSRGREQLGVAWVHDGRLVGAALARTVEPVLARAPRTGEPLAEVIVAVTENERGRGIGRQLVAALQQRVDEAAWPGLALTVSVRNPAAVRLYEKLGFVTDGVSRTGLTVMVWLSAASR
jgi:GNAT superfamily N-acetyltransferase